MKADMLIETLREELQEYGGLLSLFDDQQKAILARKPDEVLMIQGSIRAQLDTIHGRRKNREAAAREFAVSVGREPGSTVKSLMANCEEVVRPLLEALIHEVNQLISRTRRRGQQNQMLLARSIEVSQHLLQRLNPEAVTKTYGRGGRIKLTRSNGATTYMARS